MSRDIIHPSADFVISIPGLVRPVVCDRIHLHYLIATPEGTEHLVERHELGLFERQEMEAAFVDAGLKVNYDPQGLTGRGLWIGRRPVHILSSGRDRNGW